MKANENPFPPRSLTVFFDGLCPLCSREIAVYRKKDLKKAIQFVDITHPSFSAEKEGLDPIQVNRLFHVRTLNGTVLTGVAAFSEIWKVLPGFEKLHWLSQRTAVRRVMEWGYQAFVKIRPLLPRKKECESDTCYL